jgi:hypothetical protein
MMRTVAELHEEKQGREDKEEKELLGASLKMGAGTLRIVRERIEKQKEASRETCRLIAAAKKATAYRLMRIKHVLEVDMVQPDESPVKASSSPSPGGSKKVNTRSARKEARDVSRQLINGEPAMNSDEDEDSDDTQASASPRQRRKTDTAPRVYEWKGEYEHVRAAN